MAKLTCAYCGKRFERPSNMGPVPRYCSASHRQRAFEKQREQRRIDAAIARAVRIDRRRRK